MHRRPKLTLPKRKCHRKVNIFIYVTPSLKFKGLLGVEKFFFLMNFAMFCPGSHLGHVNWIIHIKIYSLFARWLHMKFGFDRQSGLRRVDV